MEPTENYSLINANEEVVRHLAESLMQQTDMCRCEKCFLDVCAIALNSLSGHYVTNKKGETIAGVLKTVMEEKVSFTVEVSKAIELVKASPQHA